MIPIFEPYLVGNEKKYLAECIDTNWVSSQGKFINKFEESLAKYHGVKYAIATSNCTTALHLSLKALDIGEGDEVLCPALTWISPANMILLSGAKLVLVDVQKDTYTIDPSLIEKKITSKTKAIIVVHLYGHAAHMDEILFIAKKYNLKVIEDNAECIGGKYKNRLLGTLGDLGTLSFFANKIITTGEGGAILTNDDSINIKCRELRDHGMSHKKKYHHIYLGYNYRMTNMQAALGLGQMEKLNQILEIRNKQMNLYYDTLSNNENFSLRNFSDWCLPAHWMMTITLNEKHDREDLIKYFYNNQIEVRPMISPVNHAEYLKDKFSNEYFKISEEVSKKSVHFPSGTGLSVNDIKYINEVLIDYFKSI